MRIQFKHILFVLFLFASFYLKAEPDTIVPNDSIEAWDNSVVDYRYPAADTIAYYKQLDEYNYNEQAESESLWDKFLNWLLSFLFTGGYVSWIGWVMLILAILALLIIIIRLFKIPIKGLFIFSRSTKVTELTFSSGNGDIESENLENMLDTFIEAEAFREATRVLFLITLRQLNRAKLIKWNVWKTDREYYYEIDNTKLKEEFLNIMRQYEYIWYGKFNLQKEYFQQLNNSFKQLSFTIDAAKNKHE